MRAVLTREQSSGVGKYKDIIMGLKEYLKLVRGIKLGKTNFSIKELSFKYTQVEDFDYDAKTEMFFIIGSGFRLKLWLTGAYELQRGV